MAISTAQWRETLSVLAPSLVSIHWGNVTETGDENKLCEHRTSCHCC